MFEYVAIIAKISNIDKLGQLLYVKYIDLCYDS